MDFGGTRVEDALSALSSALDVLVAGVGSGGLDHLADGELLDLWQGLESLRNRLPVVEHELVREAEARQLPDRFCQPSTARLMVQTLRISAGEAFRRVRAAGQLVGLTSMLGEPLPPLRPVLAGAERSGLVSPEQVDLILRSLDKVDGRGFDPAVVSTGEHLLTGHALVFGPKDLKLCADRFVDTVDPDGSVPDEALTEDRRMVELRPCRDGSWRGELRLTGSVGAKLAAVLGPLAKPRITPVTTAGGRLVEEPDQRSHPQRMHDALEEVLDRLLRAGTLPGWGGAAATVIVTISEASLRTRTGCGTTSDGTCLSAAAVVELAEQAEVIPTVLSDTGAVLDLGRTRRIASREQTLALVARDGGCSFPACDRSPEWCERHHIIAWVDGGPTDLANLTLLCRYHHHNFAARGWACRLNRDGLPEWVPPRHVDRAQRPLVNDRILAFRDGGRAAA